MKHAIVLLPALLLAGCFTLPASYEREALPVNPAYVEPAPATPGAIYAEGYDLRLFEDLRASRVGDILTIRLTERTDASKSASTSTKKGSDIEITDPIIAGRPVTRNGTEILEMDATADRTFDGEGDASQSNRLTGSITVTVVRRLPNGNLEIAGDKWITINQGEELVRITGIVRPYDVQPDNSVSSEKVANARIEYSGRGAIAQANTMGWLTRFFHMPAFPL
jgi:flagellar L-ring protein precursor FlgH